MKLLLIREANTIYRYNNTSYGLTLIGTLAKTVATVKIIDNNTIHKFYSFNDYQNIIKTFQPDVIGFNVHALNLLATSRTVARVKARFPQICLLGGGLHTFSAPEEVIALPFDIVVKGEADATIVPLLLALRDHTRHADPHTFAIPPALEARLTPIAGLNFHSGTRAKRIDTGWPPLFTDLDSLPFIDYDLVNLEDYLKFPGDDQYVTNVLITQRGCPYQCSFCQLPMPSMIKVREHSTEYKIALAEQIHDRYRPKHLTFYDNNFTLRKSSAIAFCSAYINAGLHEKMSFSCQTNVVLAMDDELVGAMKKAHCTEVQLGVERLSKRSLQRIKKNKNYDRILDNIAMLNKYLIDVVVNCPIGMPFDDPELLAEESRLFEAIIDRVKACSINTLLPAPGTEIYALTKYRQWYLDPKIMAWTPSFYHLAYGY
ncbi:MAG: radical SAM protein, partial [Magnetococcales bacterium]|nr:radical SAM protein [Magnetococcales bacterium]